MSDNSEKARAADNAIRSFQIDTRTPDSSAFVEFLASLLHYSDRTDRDFWDELHTGCSRYVEQVQDSSEGNWQPKRKQDINI